MTAQQQVAQASAAHQAQVASVQSLSARVILRLSIVESQAGSDALEKEIVISEQQVPMQIPGGAVMNKLLMQEVVRLEWAHTV